MLVILVAAEFTVAATSIPHFWHRELRADETRCHDLGRLGGG